MSPPTGSVLQRHAITVGGAVAVVEHERHIGRPMYLQRIGAVNGYTGDAGTGKLNGICMHERMNGCIDGWKN